MENAPPANIKHHQRAETAPDTRDHEFERIINAIPALAWSARPDGFAEFFNQQYLAYVGLPLEQLQGSGWTDAVHSDDRKKLVEEWQSCLASGGAVDTEARIRRFDGSYRWFLIRACPLRDDSENIIK